MKNILIIPPANQSGSLGDEAMIRVLLDHCLENIKDISIDILLFNKISDWKNIDGINRGIFIDILDNYDVPEKLNNLNQILTQYNVVYWLGADVLDGFYSHLQASHIVQLVNIAAKNKINTAILGFSFNSQAAPEVIEELKKLPETVGLNTRDSTSALNFKDQTGRQPRLVADLAILLKPSCRQDSSRSLIQKLKYIRKYRKSLIIGFNISYPAFRSTFGKIEHILEHSLFLIKKIVNEINATIVLIPHDVRKNIINGEDVSDVNLCNLLKNLLSYHFEDRILLLSPPYKASEIKSVCAHLDFAYSCRMHFSISCLDNSVPVVSVPYQEKFEGLYQLFGIEDLIIDKSIITDKGKLSEFIIEKIQSRSIYRKQIKKRIHQVRLMAESNFDNLEMYYTNWVRLRIKIRIVFMTCYSYLKMKFY